LANLDEAETALRRAYQLDGTRMPGAQLQLGQLYFRKKDYPKAIEAFEAYLRDLPNAPNAGQVREAVQNFASPIGTLIGAQMGLWYRTRLLYIARIP
jgi:tetratricopeptide (TPR) repeat protein